MGDITTQANTTSVPNRAPEAWILSHAKPLFLEAHLHCQTPNGVNFRKGNVLWQLQENRSRKPLRPFALRSRPASTTTAFQFLSASVRVCFGSPAACSEAQLRQKISCRTSGCVGSLPIGA